MKSQRLTAVWNALLLILALHPALGEEVPSETPLRSSIIVLGLSASPEVELSPACRQAVERSLLRVAKKTDTILCFEGTPTIKSPDLDLLCANPGEQLPRLWWKARAEDLGDGRLRAVVEIEAGTRAPLGPAQLLLILQTQIEEEDADLDRAMAQEIESTLADLPDLQRWFSSLKQRSDLVRAWPGGEKAAEKAGEKAPPPGAPAPRPKVEIQGKEEKPAQPRAEPVSFVVREGMVGGGFGAGPSGQLRVTPAGVVFVRGEREQWTVRWQELKAAEKDEGYWDSLYPIVLIEKGGRRRYISRIDDQGRYLPGDAILAAISRGRGASRGKTTGAPQEGKNDQLEQGDIP